MIRNLAYFIIGIHGLIHLLGFLKAWQVADLPELSIPISKTAGIAWLAASISLLVGGLAYYLHRPIWIPLLLVGALISQILIFSYWSDARYGSIVNVLLLLILLAGFSAQRFEHEFKSDAARAITVLPENSTNVTLLTEEDIHHLPPLVQKYLRYTRSIGLPKVNNFRTAMHGEMRMDKTSRWFPFTSEQYNTIPLSSRLFFMKASFWGLPTSGYHAYQHEEALMLIKVLSLLPVVDIQEAELFRAETVTYFNDLCIMAPAALIDERIKWEGSEGQKVNCTFTNHGVKIRATLVFAEDGRLVNFFSKDRVDINSHQRHLFSTPLGEYQEVNGRRLAGYGEAIWHYPDGEFIYGRFHIDSITYNTTNSTGI